MYLNMPFAYFTSPQDWLIVAIIAFPTFILPLWALIDCASRPAVDGSNKALWILAIIFGGPLGALLYFLLGRKTATS